MFPTDSNAKDRSPTNAGDGSEGTVLLDVRRLGGVLRQRWKLIAGCTAGAVLLAMGYVLAVPATYTSTAIVLVDPRQVRLTDANEVLSGIGTDSAAITSQLAVLRSRELLVPVLERENVFTDPEFQKPGDSRDTVFETIQKKLSVERQGLTYVIEVGFKSESAEKAARLTNAIVQAYVSDQISEKSRATVDATTLLTDQIAGLRESVAKSEAAVEAFKAQNGIVNIETGRTLLQSQIDRMNGQVLDARERARLAQSRYNQARSLQGDPTALASNAGILSSPTADDLREQYNTRTVERSRLRLIYGQRHPQLVALDSQIAQLETLMQAETGRIVRRLQNAMQLADADAERAEASLTSLRTDADTIGQKEVELRQLQLQAETSRDVLQQFLRRAQETSQLDRMQRSEARIISAAVPPAEPTWPKPKLLAAVAALLGAFLGTTLALLLGPAAAAAAPEPARPDRPDPVQGRIRRGLAQWSNGGSSLRLPVLGTVRGGMALHPSRGELGADALQRARTELEDAPTGEFSGDVRAVLRQSLDLLPTADGPHLVAFTSLGDTIGKYRMAYNVGLALQQVGASVLVVDLDPLNHASHSDGGIDLLSALTAGTPTASRQLIDSATHLPVLRGDGPEEEFGKALADALLEWTGSAFDFVLVNALPWQRKTQQEGLVSAPFLLAFVVGENELERVDELAGDFGTATPCCIILEPAEAPRPTPQRVGEPALARLGGNASILRAG